MQAMESLSQTGHKEREKTEGEDRDGGLVGAAMPEDKWPLSCFVVSQINAPILRAPGLPNFRPCHTFDRRSDGPSDDMVHWHCLT